MNFRTLLSPVTAAVVATVITAGATRLAPPAPTAAADDADISPVVRAHRFELVDGAGAVRAVLAADAFNGRAGLAVLDEAGRARAFLGNQALADTYGFDVFNEQGNVRIGMGAGGRAEFAGINVRDARGRIRANLFARDDETQAGFNVWDASRQRVA